MTATEAMEVIDINKATFCRRVTIDNISSREQGSVYCRVGIPNNSDRKAVPILQVLRIYHMYGQADALRYLQNHQRQAAVAGLDDTPTPRAGFLF
ncbi:hypothetical protein H1230_21525 [Paenibacillus sp. 19GGS1-52]|uniref:hypothetical protein n=1 Tax=Paenibacillus sp. 19GGS1-52 TaxID=2758563 RepID=UPI001EFA6C4B|nr:hypothetical protein [Paenibacillus sp. 19GGS1-52]ULO05637.1 hypothetical protein H1230_21525 [Paenibacillus sp. 19GGS1-52]